MKHDARDRSHQFEPSEISARLVTLREWIGLPREQMAATLRMPTRTYRAWERPGSRKWRSTDFVTKVCSATGASAAWMVSGSYYRESPSPIPLASDGLPLPKGRMIVSDPDEIAFLEAVRALPPEARDRLTVLRQAIDQRRPAHVIRGAALNYLAAMGVPQRLAVVRADRFMRGLNAARTNEVTEAHSGKNPALTY